MELQFYDKQGKIFPFSGNEQQFNQWNKFGFSLVPNTPPVDQGNKVVVPQPATGLGGNTGGMGGTGGSTFDQDPITKFNQAIIDMLKGSQGISGQEKARQYQQQLGNEQYKRATQPLSEIGSNLGDMALSPDQIMSIRKGREGTMQPEVDAVAYKIKSQDARLQNFESILGTMRDIGKDIAVITPSKDVIDGYVNMIEQGGSPTAVPDEVRSQVISKVDWSKWKAATTSTKSDELTLNQKIDAEMSLQSKVQAANKLSTEVIRNMNGVNALWNTYSNGKIGLNAMSQAIITSYGKILDPGSVVRESEYARTPEGLGLVDKAEGWLLKMQQGGAGLTKANLQEFVNAINILGKNAQSEINKQIDIARAYGEKYGLDTSLLGGSKDTSKTVVQTIEYPKGSGKYYNVDQNGELTPQ